MPNELIKKAIESVSFDAATLTDDHGRWVLTMTRTLAGPPEQVWPWLVEPDRLIQWSPIVFDRVLTGRGPATATENPGDDPVDAEVLEFDPPRQLIHRWDEHTVRWTLEPAPDGCRLTLEQRFAETDLGPLMAAGWHVCLAVLTVTLDGDPVGRVVGSAAMDYGWERLRDHYAERWPTPDPSGTTDGTEGSTR